MVWAVVGMAALALFIVFWLLMMFIFIRFAIPSEPAGAGRVGLTLVLIGANLALIAVLAAPLYSLAGSSGILKPSVAVATTLQALRTAGAIAGLLILIPGGWMRIRAILRENKK